MENKKYTCIDAFCGAGGLSLGLKQAGFDLLYGFDKDEDCIETLKENKDYLSHQVEVADVKDLKGEKLLEKLGLEKGELFLLAGGPPCQGFSVQRTGDDEDERNSLVLDYFDLIQELKPKYFLMENVTGLKGKRGEDVLEALIEEAEDAGYNAQYETLDAQDFGVPQRRKRVFVIGERKNGSSEYEFPSPTTPNESRTVEDTIGHLPELGSNGKKHPDVPNHRADNLSEKNIKRLEALEPGQGRVDLPEELLTQGHKKRSADKIGHRNVYGRMRWEGPAPTITARFDSFTRGQFGHPEQNRTISLREGALLQTFPEDFVFKGNKSEIASQIGNAVPPKLAEEIGKSIINYHEQKSNHG